MPRFVLWILALGIVILETPSIHAETMEPSFLNDVLPILTRQGCNQGACHGKGSGQNGFRLSLRGYAPEQDYRWITREHDGRRIDNSVPEQSLFLTKPVGLAPHEGGKLFDVHTREYQVLRKWIQAGAPGPKKDDPRLTKLQITPIKKQLKIGEEIQLHAKGIFTDGRERDVTWLTKFDSNDAGLMLVTPEGKAKALRHGETAIRAAFQTEVAVSILTVPYETDLPKERFSQRSNFVDEHVFNKLQALKIEPSDLCSDEEFLRRVFLDTIGTLPTADEVRTFLQDSDTNKRAKVIDTLLERPEFADYWAIFFGDLFQNRKERDHDVRGTKGVRAFHNWIRKQIIDNRPWDQMARDVLTATGSTAERPEIGYFIVTVGEHHEPEKSEVTASVAQSFLGTRIGCAQCHNHPLERYTQDDYYHFAAFFSRVKLDRKEEKVGSTNLRVSLRDPNQNRNPIGVRQPRTGQFLKPQPLDRTVMLFDLKDDPRIKLVDWMTDPQNEYFTGSIINRIWKHYLGTGLVEPVDDLRATNPPSNPELWAALNQEFRQSKMNWKQLMRVILNSRTYQLSSSTKSTNQADTRFYSHYYARRLPAEVMADAISQSTGVVDRFPGYPEGMRTIQLPDPGLKSYFLTLFGRSDRVTACACERLGDVTMPQLLHLQNGQEVINKIRSPQGKLASWLKQIPDDSKLIDELFLNTFSRKANDQERQTVLQMIQASDPREEVYRDLFWALLNSKNFAFNH